MAVVIIHVQHEIRDGWMDGWMDCLNLVGCLSPFYLSPAVIGRETSANHSSDGAGLQESFYYI